MSAQIVRVRQVMKTEFDTVDSMTTVYDALKSMRHIETKCLIVNKRHNDDEYGMLLLSDVARKVIGLNRSPERVNVYEVMAKPVITVDPEMNIRYCARLFDRFELSRAPVAENGKVVGIVSFTDMVLRGLLPE
ncbi:MAG: histidine kinase [Gammaproteobacteria bacterium]|nr:MAG: histidine kinase [Gammaproteobacteria bacterium]